MMVARLEIEYIWTILFKSDLWCNAMDDLLMEMYLPNLFLLLQLEDPIPSNLIRLQRNNNTGNFLYFYILPQ